MAEENNDPKLKRTNQKRHGGKNDFNGLYDQLAKENKTLQVNKPFWTTKGNSQKYFCTLCNIGVHVSSNLNIFKSAILAHVEDKYHKKRHETFVATETATKTRPMNVRSTNKTDEEKSLSEIVDELNVLDIVQLEEDALIYGNEKPDYDTKNMNYNWRKELSLVDFNSIYDSFEKSNPVVKTSKQFIVKTGNGRDYFCTLCKVLVFNSLSASEFRYNLFVHLNEEAHREKLPNYSEVTKDFDKVMLDLSKVLPASYKNELNCFEVGPVFRFVKCSLCDVAVSCNLHRLENHVKDESHILKKKNQMNKESVETESLNHRTREAFRKLVVRLDSEFKKDIKYIHIGKIPGYVLCSLCSYVSLPTKFYVETHLTSAVHQKNKKATTLINRNSMFKVTLNDLLSTLPGDMKDYNFFKETACGLTCKRCDATVPATSYDLYTHINKERLACVSG